MSWSKAHQPKIWVSLRSTNLGQAQRGCSRRFPRIKAERLRQTLPPRTGLANHAIRDCLCRTRRKFLQSRELCGLLGISYSRRDVSIVVVAQAFVAGIAANDAATGDGPWSACAGGAVFISLFHPYSAR